MPMSPTNSHDPHSPRSSDTRGIFLAQLLLGVGLVGIVLFFGLIVWQLVRLPHAGQPAAQQHEKPDRLVATPRTEIIEAAAEEPAALSRTVPAPLPNNSEGKRQLDSGRKQPAIDASPRLPDNRTADQIVEERLRASEEELRE